MTREEIIRMAREAGFEQNSLGMTYTSGALPELLERFAGLIAAAEREACAKVCADIAMHRDVGSFGMLVAHTCANEILERGSA